MRIATWVRICLETAHSNICKSVVRTITRRIKCFYAVVIMRAEISCLVPIRSICYVRIQDIPGLLVS